MDFFEILGFFILILFLLGPLLRKIFGKKKAPPRPRVEREGGRPSIAEEVHRFHPPAEPQPWTFEAPVEEEEKAPPPEKREEYVEATYHQHRVSVSKIQTLLKRPGIGKEMVILREVIDAPVALRKLRFEPP